MKKVFVLFSIFFPGLIAAQESVSKHSISISAGNAGQIIDELNDFYGFLAPSYANSTSISFRHFIMNYEYTRENIAWGGNLGYGYNRSYWRNSNEKLANLNFYNFSFFGNYTLFNSGRFRLISGFEIPYYFVDTYFVFGTNSSIDEKHRVEGGSIFGFNHLTAGKFFINDRIFIRSDVSYGFLVFNLGGRSNIDQGGGFIISKEEQNYFMTGMSNTSLSLGIGFIF
jgi:hypothetical protein